MNADVKKAGLVADLAEVVRQIERYWYAPNLSYNFIRANHDEILRNA